jgi:hypothetical protein
MAVIADNEFAAAQLPDDGQGRDDVAQISRMVKAPLGSSAWNEVLKLVGME